MYMQGENVFIPAADFPSDGPGRGMADVCNQDIRFINPRQPERAHAGYVRQPERGKLSESVRRAAVTQ